MNNLDEFDMKRFGKLSLLCGLFLGCLLFIFLHWCGSLPTETSSNMSGEVTEEALSQVSKILGKDFSEYPSTLFYYFSKPDKFGGYSTYVKATITKKEFDEIVKTLKLSRIDQWPIDSPLRSAARWTVPNELSLPWWDIDDPDDNKELYGSLRGEVGFCFAKYREL